ncbi:MAG: hypothetical protein ACYCQJ_13700 [Nitrososphaerales archaeon]
MDIRRALVTELKIDPLSLGTAFAARAVKPTLEELVRSLQDDHPNWTKDLIVLEFEKLLDDGVIVNRDGFYYYAA